MTNTNQTTEVTRVSVEPPTQVIQKTISSSKPEAVGEAPQAVYETKKSIFRYNQVIWYILGVIEVLLIFRVVLKVLGASAYSGFTTFIYAITYPLAQPFVGVVGTSTMGASQMEWSTMLAAIVYICIAWALVYLLDLIYPITPEDVETQ